MPALQYMINKTHLFLSHTPQQQRLPLLPLGHGCDITAGHIRQLHQALVLHSPLLQVCVHEVGVALIDSADLLSELGIVGVCQQHLQVC